jgi:polar amino acid transport system substrate-binding protein
MYGISVAGDGLPRVGKNGLRINDAMKVLNLILGSVFLLLGGICRAEPVLADSLVLMSEEFPPYNFTDNNGDRKGTSIDLMVLILERMNSQKTRKDIEMLPWTRAYQKIQKEKNTVLFAMVKTTEREKLFKWVGPISTANNALIARKSQKIKIGSIEDAKKYTIGVVRDAAAAELVRKAGIPWENLNVVAKPEQNILKLERGRIDLIAYDEIVTRWILRDKGMKPEDFETVYLLEKGEHYFAFNKDTPDALIQRMQAILDDLKKEGKYQEILDKYLK